MVERYTERGRNHPSADLPLRSAVNQVAGFPVGDWKEGGLIDCLSGQGIHTRDVGTRGARCRKRFNHLFEET